MAESHRLRTHKLQIWLVEEERQLLIKNAYEHGLSQADYVRKLIMCEGLVRGLWTMDKSIGKEFLYEINRIGNNINQIAYNTNYQHFASHNDWEALEKSYYELLGLLGQIPFLQKDEVEEWKQRVSMLLQKKEGSSETDIS